MVVADRAAVVVDVALAFLATGAAVSFWHLDAEELRVDARARRVAGGLQLARPIRGHAAGCGLVRDSGRCFAPDPARDPVRGRARGSGHRATRDSWLGYARQYARPRGRAPRRGLQAGLRLPGTATRIRRASGRTRASERVIRELVSTVVVAARPGKSQRVSSRWSVVAARAESAGWGLRDSLARLSIGRQPSRGRRKSRLAALLTSGCSARSSALVAVEVTMLFATSFAQRGDC